MHQCCQNASHLSLRHVLALCRSREELHLSAHLSNCLNVYQDTDVQIINVLSGDGHLAIAGRPLTTIVVSGDARASVAAPAFGTLSIPDFGKQPHPYAMFLPVCKMICGANDIVTVCLQVHWQATLLELTGSLLHRSWASLVGFALTPWMQSVTGTLS